MKLKDLVMTLDAIMGEFDVDVIDLNLLIAAKDKWDEGKNIRITDLIRDYKIASPATVHCRIAQELVGKKLVKLETNPDDAREKFIVAGPRFKALLKFVGDK